MQKFFKQKKNGFTLIEALVAISIFTMSLLGIMSILASNIANISYAKQKMTATYLAQEGIECARNRRDTLVIPSASGWSTFRDNSLDFTAPPNCSNSSRVITKDIINNDEVRITSTVTWTQGSGPKTVTFSEELFNWVE